MFYYNMINIIFYFIDIFVSFYNSDVIYIHFKNKCNIILLTQIYNLDNI